ncbi:hypothetical protein N7481_010265 [Penicillium waksmanii]|uniref:uncharacterized protein n=1 Tax=Penicillium waksmanii TaxID=69791 RepID=UPI002547A9D8|nr:uncharacterized protein N7481_010265 [Penicillium waksmanii]KAJ5976558.1 hypothetical protein N7481_010265 [Penicillium waksmanii]
MQHSVALSAKMPTTRRARKGISDAQKQALRIYVSETHPTPSQRACVEWFRSKFGHLIDRATVSRKYQHLDTSPAGLNMRLSTSHWPKLDQALFEWQQRHQDAGFPITGPLLRLKAIEYWRKIPEYTGFPEPLFSDGWLTRFKQRHSLRYHTFHGESSSVPTSIHDDIKPIQVVCNQYQPEDIYNMDETGLYWRRMLNGGLSTNGHAGQKRDKARITIVVTTNATGSDRMPLWLIGTAKTPRALRGVNIHAIGCTWRWNKKAWMRSGIMAEWLYAFYKHIGKQRRVLLLLDNFSAHSSALEDMPPPSNIKVLFLPANTTSVYQPLDQGIIQNLKHHYRKKWMYWMINILDRNLDPDKKISLNYTLRWLTQAWRNNVLDQTIKNCFIKSTIIGRDVDQTHNIPRPEVLELMPLYQSLINRFPADIGRDTHSVMSLDDFLNPSDENDLSEPDLSDIIAYSSGGDDVGDGGSDTEQDDEYIFGPPVELPSNAEAMDSIQKALLWAQHQEGTTEEDIRQIEGLERLFTRLQVDGMRQRTLDEMGFLNRK